ncbi:MAG: sugar ABC transporter ATP-binding protein [Hespellia sp.]|jgi:ribose transport system ATP-binding protein|nr:sugar ABC transporter ATP-binding protein [Hespellia sp.]
MVILEVKNITKRFNGVHALDQASLRCKRGKITGLLGANGSGKSTLSKIITGVYHADSGEISFEGKQVSFSNPAESKKNGISMVFQNMSLIDDLTVWQNIVLGCEDKKGMLLDDEAAKKKARDVLLELSSDIEINSRLSQLSTSDMQIVEIAKAMVYEPKLLILDEPTASLENKQAERLFECMHSLADKGVAMIFTSHRMKEVMEMCDEVYVFKNGKNAGYLDFEKDDRDEDVVVSMITGKDRKGKIVSDRRKKERAPLAEKMLEVKDLSYLSYLRHISFDVKKGEILGIGGLTGQGQEELMLALAGYYRQLDSGTFYLEQEQLQLNRPSRAIEKGIFLVPGDRNKEGLFLKHSIYHNVIFPKLASRKHPIVIPKKKYQVLCEEAMDTLSVAALHGTDTQVMSLSGGNAQKIVVAKWLNFQTKVMLLSDPAKGVDIGAKEDLYAFMRNMVNTENNSVILYASDSDELIQYCDRVLIMYEGKIIGELTGDDINEEAIQAMGLKGVQHKGARTR